MGLAIDVVLRLGTPLVQDRTEHALFVRDFICRATGLEIVNDTPRGAALVIWKMPDCIMMEARYT